ncbi:hypothetical protein [Phaffia rhodozyma]|uniref:Uncharacterized protein n=1 Tax=Phaffia rhodozyma TaxID=264483 RepID=A0A0F7SP16_PHARH|nr:hypothetical protein [Phaffia rhodozyma]
MSLRTFSRSLFASLGRVPAIEAAASRSYASKPPAKQNVSASTADRTDSNQAGPYQPADYTTEVAPEGLGALPGQGGKQGEMTNESGSANVDSQARSSNETKETVEGPLANAGKSKQ